MIADDDTSRGANISLRDTLFGDLPLEYWERDGREPWASFASAAELHRQGDARSARDILLRIVAQPKLETRHRLQAWSALRALGEMPQADVYSQVYGVVVDVRVSGGCDTLAAYADLSARYINYDGGGVIWDHPDDSLDSLIEELLSVTATTRSQIARGADGRRSLPGPGKVRLSVLCPGGCISLERTAGEMQADPALRAAWDAASKLLVALVDTSM